MTKSTGADRDATALARAQEIVEELRELEERLQGSTSAEVSVTLLERATELAEEAARLLEQVGSPRP